MSEDAQKRYQAALEKLSRSLVDEGMLIEAGWIAMRAACLPPDTGEHQLHEMRLAFFAGAQHLFGSIMTILDEDREPTDADMKRMDLIDQELHRFNEQYKAMNLPIAGRA